MRHTKGQIEALISEAVIKFEKEYMGRGPLETKTYLIDDMVLVRLKRTLTPAEHQLSTAPDARHGRDLIKDVRIALMEKGRPLLEAVLQDILKRRVVSLHQDISTRTGERVVLFTLDGIPDLGSPLE